MRKFPIIILISLIISCGRQDNIEPAPCQPSSAILGTCNVDTTITDQELLNKVYSSFKYHDKFNTQELNDYRIVYVTNTSIGGQSPWSFLCTDNFDTAALWVEQSDLYDYVQWELKETLETDVYYEFLRVNSDNPNKMSMRVFKCSFVQFCSNEPMDDSFYPFQVPTLIISDNNVTQSDLVEFAEFLTFSFSYNFRGRKFLKTESCETKDSIYVSLLGTSVVYGDWGVTDRITLTLNNFGTHKHGGKILTERVDLRTIDGKTN